MSAGYSPSIVVTLGDLLNLTDQKRASPAVRGAGATGGPPPPSVTFSKRERSSLQVDFVLSLDCDIERTVLDRFSDRQDRVREVLMFAGRVGSGRRAPTGGRIPERRTGTSRAQPRGTGGGDGTHTPYGTRCPYVARTPEYIGRTGQGSAPTQGIQVCCIHATTSVTSSATAPLRPLIPPTGPVGGRGGGPRVALVSSRHQATQWPL